jgi:hypothetical protein
MLSDPVSVYHRVMRRRIFLAVLLTMGLACDRSPAGPSRGFSLRVQVVDDITRQPIANPMYRLQLQLAGASASFTQPVVDGTAVFPNVLEGEYRLTTAALFGYLQLDLLTVLLDQSKTMTLSLTPIDDLGVEQILVDGQGTIPVGGTIAIPLRGVTLRMRGKYQSPRSPWPARNLFSATVPSLNPDVDGFGHEGGRTESGPLSPSDFELAIPNWTPCSRIVDGRLVNCYTSADTLMLTMSTPFEGGFGGSPLIRKYQKWALKFELVPGCCLP